MSQVVFVGKKNGLYGAEQSLSQRSAKSVLPVVETR